MDLKSYYQKIRAEERGIPEKFVVVSSRETGDGGKAGVLTEVDRYTAARMIVDGKAGRATEEEEKAYRTQTAEGRRAAEELAAASRVHVTLVAPAELPRLKTKG